jgi:hypothetical protein
MRDCLYRPISLIAVKELTPVGMPISIGLKYIHEVHPCGDARKGGLKHSRITLSKRGDRFTIERPSLLQEEIWREDVGVRRGFPA